MSDIVLYAKLAVALLGAGVIAVLFRRYPWSGLSEAAFTRAALTSLAVARLSLYVVVLVVLRVPAQSDVLTYYDLAKHVLAGEVPYRDFFNGYAPLFPYLAAVPVSLWDSPKSIVLLGVLLEIVAFPLWLAVGRRVFGEAEARAASVLYIANPFIAWAIPLAGQNNTWLALALALSLHLLGRNRSLASGVSLAAGVVAVKFLSLLHAPVLFIGAPRRVRFGLGFAALPFLVYGFLYLDRISVFASLRYHAADASCGNIPFLLTLFGLDVHDPALNRIYNLAGVAIIVAVFLIPLVRHRGFNPKQVIHMITLLLFTLMLVSRKSYSSYLIIAFFAIMLTVASGGLSRRALYALLAWSTAMAMESSLWFRWLHQRSLEVVWRSPLPEGLSRPAALCFLAVELTLLGGYVVCFVEAWRRVAEAKSAEGALDTGARGAQSSG